MSPNVPVGVPQRTDQQQQQQTKSAAPSLPMPFVGFPIEILEIICFYLDSPSYPLALDCFKVDSKSLYGTVGCMHASKYERQNVLKALSLTCRTLRVNSVPLLWRDLVVLSEHHQTDSVAWEGDLSTQLLEKLDIVTVREPFLAQCVQTLSISLTTYRCASVLQELARCIPLFECLHTLQIASFPHAKVEMLKSAFRRVRCETVQNILLPCTAWNILSSFPRVKVICLMPGQGGSRWPVSLTRDSLKLCPDIEGAFFQEYECLSLLNPGSLTRLTFLSIDFNRVHSLRYDSLTLNALNALPSLRKLEVLHHFGSKERFINDVRNNAAAIVSKAARVQTAYVTIRCVTIGHSFAYHWKVSEVDKAGTLTLSKVSCAESRVLESGDCCLDGPRMDEKAIDRNIYFF